MSVEIAWDLITSGDDGTALAESIREFIHAKFQQITLPKFINSVHVHSFEFGSVCPNIEIKDISDPLPDFYEDGEEQQGPADPLSSNVNEHRHRLDTETTLAPSQPGLFRPADLNGRVAALNIADDHPGQHAAPSQLQGAMAPSSSEGVRNLTESLSGTFARSGTPGIPGGTSNMSYFHFPVGGLSGAQTPLAAVAGGGPFGTQAWLHDQQSRHADLARRRPSAHDSDGNFDEGLARPRTAGSVSSPELGSPFNPSSPEKRPIGCFSAEKASDEISSSDILAGPPPPPSAEKSSPADLQVVARVTYNGDVRMMLTAEIMLDYPMPSFIKIPLKLSIIGVAFDGVAILAYIKNKMHFCFLDPEDADTLVGSAFAEDSPDPARSEVKQPSIGSLLREIHVETEIGRQESGKQVLKNVGKVERFVLEQVRRIFEDEFVFPSYWTFLV